MVLSGFSGRATRLLARTLANRGESSGHRFIKLTISKLGAYIVQYRPSEEVDDPNDILRTDLIGTPTITSAARRSHCPPSGILRNLLLRGSLAFNWNGFW